MSYRNDTTDVLQIGIVDGSGNTKDIAIEGMESATPKDKWSHIALTADGTLVKAYINGILKGSKKYDGKFSASNLQTTIGAYGDGSSSYGRFFKGSIDDVRIYSRALSWGEVRELCLMGDGMDDAKCGLLN